MNEYTPTFKIFFFSFFFHCFKDLVIVKVIYWVLRWCTFEFFFSYSFYTHKYKLLYFPYSLMGSIVHQAFILFFFYHVCKMSCYTVYFTSYNIMTLYRSFCHFRVENTVLLSNNE